MLGRRQGGRENTESQVQTFKTLFTVRTNAVHSQQKPGVFWRGVTLQGHSRGLYS